MTKKKLREVMALVYNNYGQEAAARLADQLKALGFRYATSSGLSIGMGDFEDLKELSDLIADGEKKAAEIGQQFEEGFINNDERYRLTVDNWTEVDAKVEHALAEKLLEEDSTMSVAINSGARGSLAQMKDAVGMIGVRADATGKPIELPVRSNFKQGLSPLEYFTATRGTRKSLIDIALRTADSGYLTRRLVDVAQDVFTIDEDANDPGFEIHKEDEELNGVPFANRITGRFAAEEVKKHVKSGELITSEIANKIAEDQSVTSVKIMSVLSCTSAKGVARKSYGVDLATGELVEGRYPVGVIAAQSIGEPGTQLSLDSKHRAGAVTSADDVTQGLNRVEEILEVRPPKGQAYLSEISGTARVSEEGDKYIVEVSGKTQEPVKLALGDKLPQVADETEVIIGELLAVGRNGQQLTAPISGQVEVKKTLITITPDERTHVRYEIPGYRQLVVKDDDKVTSGQRLTGGSIDLHELVKLKGIEAAQRYIMNEVLFIFASQGQAIADKHLEVIVRQMFSRVMIEDAGDSGFITGDIVSKLAVEEANEQLAAAGKNLVKYNQLLLGITKASLSTDSFLSAASFQDTTRVLISAATSGKVDKLFGLKENVILGRKIPVGTGALQDDEEVEDQG